MSLKEKLKQNNALRHIVKKIKIYKSYIDDAKDFSKYYLESAETRGNQKYRIMLLLHSLEKGLCSQNPRPFGKEKVITLTQILENYKDKESFEYLAGISILNQWCVKYEEMGWTDIEPYQKVKSFISKYSNFIDTGAKVYYSQKPVNPDALKASLLNRRSVREYDEKELKEEDILFAMEFFQAAPSACNRQMCKIYKIENKDMKQLLEESIMGLGGFDKETVTYFIVTYDISAFDFSGERNQGYLNAGLAAMNFINGLHIKGIGSCFMQWANKRSEDVKIRETLGIDKNEHIAVVIGAGYYKKETLSPVSARKPIYDIYKIIK